MWFFNQSVSIKDKDLLKGWTDHHSHLIFGVDDGVRTLEESLSILQKMEEAGTKTLWLTPHIMEDFPNTVEQLKDIYQQLKESYHGPIELKLASENMMDNLFDDRIKEQSLLPIGNKRTHLLVETSYYSPPMTLKERLKAVQSIGLHPLLAHPERFKYMDMKMYDELKNKGVYFQLNMPSIVGAYGEDVQKKAKELLKRGMYDCCGGDTHRLRGFLCTYHGKVKSSELAELRRLVLTNI